MFMDRYRWDALTHGKRESYEDYRRCVAQEMLTDYNNLPNVWITNEGDARHLLRFLSSSLTSRWLVHSGGNQWVIESVGDLTQDSAQTHLAFGVDHVALLGVRKRFGDCSTMSPDVFADNVEIASATGSPRVLAAFLDWKNTKTGEQYNQSEWVSRACKTGTERTKPPSRSAELEKQSTKATSRIPQSEKHLLRRRAILEAVRQHHFSGGAQAGGRETEPLTQQRMQERTGIDRKQIRTYCDELFEAHVKTRYTNGWNAYRGLAQEPDKLQAWLDTKINPEEAIRALGARLRDASSRSPDANARDDLCECGDRAQHEWKGTPKCPECYLELAG